MKNLSFNDGFQEFTINNDKNRVIRFNPADPNILKRFDEVYKNLGNQASELSDTEVSADGTPVDELEETAENLRKFDSILKEQFNYLFGSDVFDTVFAGQSPLCIVGSGKKQMYLFEAFMTAAFEVITSEVEKVNKASAKKSKSYTDAAKKLK